MNALHTHRPRSAVSRIALSASVLLATTAAFAAGIDAVLMDPAIGAQSITFRAASADSPTTLPIVFTPPTRDAYTKTQPLQLPCDLASLAVGLAFKNVGAQPLYIEWSGAVYLNGSEKTPIPDGYGRPVVHIADGRKWQPGEVGSGGFIFVAEAPLYSWAVDSLPPNVPLRLQLESRGFTADTLDFARGGYSLGNLAPEQVLWNNNYRVWIQRTCP